MLIARLVHLVSTGWCNARHQRDQRGQATAEYALVLVAAAIIGTAVIVWASGTGLIADLFDNALGRVLDAMVG